MVKELKLPFIPVGLQYRLNQLIELVDLSAEVGKYSDSIAWNFNYAHDICIKNPKEWEKFYRDSSDSLLKLRNKVVPTPKKVYLFPQIAANGHSISVASYTPPKVEDLELLEEKSTEAGRPLGNIENMSAEEVQNELSRLERIIASRF